MSEPIRCRLSDRRGSITFALEVGGRDSPPPRAGLTTDRLVKFSYKITRLILLPASWRQTQRSRLPSPFNSAVPWRHSAGRFAVTRAEMPPGRLAPHSTRWRGKRSHEQTNKRSLASIETAQGFNRMKHRHKLSQRQRQRATSQSRRPEAQEMDEQPRSSVSKPRSPPCIHARGRWTHQASPGQV